MSFDAFEAMRAVRELEVPTAQKVVLMMLISRADRTGECWPSVALLAADTGQNERTVRRSLNTLEESGYVRRRVINGNRRAYSLTFDQTGPHVRVCGHHARADTTPDRAPCPERSDTTPGGDRAPCPHSADTTPDKHSNRTTQELPKAETDVSLAVEEVWSHYVAKRAAVRQGAAPKLTPERRKKIRARLRTFTAEQLKQALGVIYAPNGWHVANGQLHPELWLRSDAQVDKLLERAPQGRKPRKVHREDLSQQPTFVDIPPIQRRRQGGDHVPR